MVINIISKEEFLKNNKKPNQENVWNEISDLWIEYKKKPFFDIENFLKGKKGLVIDLGCGSSRNMIKNDSLEYYGVDLSANQLKAAENKIKQEKIKAVLFKSSADKLDKKIFKNEMFDYGLFIATLHCIDNEKARLNAIKEFYRVLKPGAEALITVWNSDDERFKHVNNHGDIYMSWKKDGKEYFRYYYLYSETELSDLLKKVGFKILEIKKRDDNIDSQRTLKERFSKKNLIIHVKK